MMCVSMSWWMWKWHTPWILRSWPSHNLITKSNRLRQIVQVLGSLFVDINVSVCWIVGGIYSLISAPCELHLTAWTYNVAPRRRWLKRLNHRWFNDVSMWPIFVFYICKLRVKYIWCALTTSVGMLARPSSILILNRTNFRQITLELADMRWSNISLLAHRWVFFHFYPRSQGMFLPFFASTPVTASSLYHKCWIAELMIYDFFLRMKMPKQGNDGTTRRWTSTFHEIVLVLWKWELSSTGAMTNAKSILVVSFSNKVVPQIGKHTSVLWQKFQCHQNASFVVSKHVHECFSGVWCVFCGERYIEWDE